MCAQLHVCIVHCSRLVPLQGWHAFGQDLAKLASHNQANSGFQNGVVETSRTRDRKANWPNSIFKHLGRSEYWMQGEQSGHLNRSSHGLAGFPWGNAKHMGSCCSKGQTWKSRCGLTCEMRSSSVMHLHTHTYNKQTDAKKKTNKQANN